MTRSVGDAINWNAGSIWGSHWSLLLVVHIEAFNQICGKASLVHMKRDIIFGHLPWEMNSQKSFHYIHEVNLDEV